MVKAKNSVELTGLRMNGIDLNGTDINIIRLLNEKPCSISEINNHTKLAPVNVWKHIKHLNKAGLLDVPEVKRGKKKVISLSKEIEKDPSMKQILEMVLLVLTVKQTTDIIKDIKDMPQD